MGERVIGQSKGYAAITEDDFLEFVQKGLTEQSSKHVFKYLKFLDTASKEFKKKHHQIIGVFKNLFCQV